MFFAATQLHRRYFSKIAAQEPSMSVCWFKSVKNAWPLMKYDKRLLGIVQQASRKTDNSRGRALPAGAAPLYRWALLLKSMWLYNSYYRFLSREDVAHSVVWNGLKHRQQIWCLCCDELGIKVRYMENGLLPGHTTLDVRGVNYGNSLSRDPSFYRDYRVTYSGNQPEPTAIEPLARPDKLPKRFIFVPFQVNGDSQIVCYSPWVKNMAHLAEILLAAQPAFKAAGLQLVVKPHPKCSTPNANVLQLLQEQGVTVITDIDSKTLVDHSQAVLTINSTVGIETLAAGKKLIVVGQAFYRMPGMTLGADNLDELNRAIGQLTDWTPDADAISGLFDYLRQEYQITGDWRAAEPAHVQGIIKRLHRFNGETPWQ